MSNDNASKNFIIGKNVVIEPGAVITATKGRIGDRSIIRSGARIEGTYVELGNESYLDHGATIGGGSCWDEKAYLKAGCWLHMGWNSQINIARGVDIGAEVGIGIETKVLTHGAYLPVDSGFPVQWGPVTIGSKVWLPHAWVNPNVCIGDNVVVAAGSVINTDIPSGCLAGGVPAKVIKENAYPKETKLDGAVLLNMLSALGEDVLHYLVVEEYPEEKIVVFQTCGWMLEKTEFLIKKRIIKGSVTNLSEKVKNQLRRNGIRFKFYDCGGIYVPWE
jgi:acetyltransferase-like isoleucine patch superfamily enzyme